MNLAPLLQSPRAAERLSEYDREGHDAELRNRRRIVALSLVASGAFSIKRTDFSIGGGEWNEGDLVADEVPVTFRLLLGPATP